MFLNTKEVDGSKNLGISMPRGSDVVPAPKDYTSPYVLLASNKDSMAITGVIINSDGGLGVRGFDRISGGDHL